MTDTQDASPADSFMNVIPAGADVITNTQLQSQLITILSIVTGQAAQTQWICEQIQQFYASMPPFMRKGMVPNG